MGWSLGVIVPRSQVASSLVVVTSHNATTRSCCQSSRLPSAGGGISPDADLLSGTTHRCNPPQVDTEGNGAGGKQRSARKLEPHMARATAWRQGWALVSMIVVNCPLGVCLTTATSCGTPRGNNEFLNALCSGPRPWEGFEWGPLELLVCPLSTFHPSSSTVLQSCC